jgi:glycosyltransferase involved in cell wall biosynthesis
MALCPHLAPRVRRGCAKNDRYVVLFRGHAEQLAESLGTELRKIEVIGAGYQEAIFNNNGQGREPDSRHRLLYIGKYSHAKGLPWLLDAIEQLLPSFPDLELHVAGSGSGPEAETLRRRMQNIGSAITLHGQLDQRSLAKLMRRCHLCVLPSFYEGVPLVLVEALACGCRIVCTELPGVVDQLVPHLSPYMEQVPLPRLRGVDSPEPADESAFVDRLVAALRLGIETPPIDHAELADSLWPFTWGAVFGRLERIWKELLSYTPPAKQISSLQ